MADDINPGGAGTSETEGPAAGEGGRKTDIFADDRVRKLQAEKDREIAQMRAQLAKVTDERDQIASQYNAWYQNVNQVDPESAQTIAAMAAKDAELDYLRRRQAQAQAQVEQAQAWEKWRQDCATYAREAGINPGEPAFLAAVESGEFGLVMRTIADVVRNSTRPGESTPSNPGPTATVPVIPEGGTAAPNRDRATQRAIEYAARARQVAGNPTQLTALRREYMDVPPEMFKQALAGKL